MKETFSVLECLTFERARGGNLCAAGLFNAQKEKKTKWKKEEIKEY